MANETVLFKRGDSATITSTPVTDGQILFDTSGNGKMYLDNGTDRLEMGGAITVDASLSKTSTNAIQNKAVTGNILNSLAEVSAATQQNTIAGALALKEVNSSLTADNSQKFQFAYDSESGKYGYKAKVEGADTFFPFSSGSIENGVINLSTSSKSIITIGFEPDMVILINKYANSTYSPLIQISNKNNHLIWGSNMDKWNTSQNNFSVSFTNKGFSCKAFSSYSAYETYWYAIKI